MTPFLIESYATDINDEVDCSSNVDCKGRVVGMSMTKSDCMRKSFESCTSQQENKSSPHFSLRKRTVPDDQRGDVISSYNSDFLTGLFEDLANASTPSVGEELDPRLDETLPSKKSRLSLTRSTSRCGRSYANLVAVSPMPEQGHRRVINVKALLDTTKTQRASQQGLHHCVSSSSSDESSSFCKLAFPHLPSTVSDSSLSLTRKGQQSPESEKNTYGWFVEIDDDHTEHAVDAYSTSTNNSLAFIAPTAPKAANHDAEVEWAKAADTIDDVLGDFF
jgi:hypothetical protein